MATFNDLPLDVARLIMTQITAHLQGDSDADTTDGVMIWCNLASVCRW